MRHATITTLVFMVIWIVVAVFIRVGVAMLFFALSHLAVTTAIWRTGMIEMVLGRKLSEERKAKLSRVASSFFFKQYWILTNVAYIALAVWVLRHDFRFIDLIVKAASTN